MGTTQVKATKIKANARVLGHLNIAGYRFTLNIRHYLTQRERSLIQRATEGLCTCGGCRALPLDHHIAARLCDPRTNRRRLVFPFDEIVFLKAKSNAFIDLWRVQVNADSLNDLAHRLTLPVRSLRWQRP